MPFPKTLKSLCTPAFVYFVIATLGLIVAMYQNISNNQRYNLGSFSCQCPSTFLIFVFKVIYLLFWTWVLDLMCRDGHTGIAWFLVLLPFLLLFLIIALISSQQQKEKKRKQIYNKA